MEKQKITPEKQAQFNEALKYTAEKVSVDRKSLEAILNYICEMPVSRKLTDPLVNDIATILGLNKGANESQ